MDAAQPDPGCPERFPVAGAARRFLVRPRLEGDQISMSTFCCSTFLREFGPDGLMFCAVLGMKSALQANGNVM